MGKIYYLFSITFVFFSLQHAFSQVGCSDLEITAVEGGTVCGGGSVVLRATSSGTGSDVFWHDASTGGNYLASGEVFQSPEITTTTSYWVSEIIGTGVTLTGEGKVAPTAASPGGYTLAAGLEFTAASSFTIVDVEAFSYAAAGGVISTIQLQDSNGQMIQEILNFPVPPGGAGANMVPFTIPLNFNVPAPGNYRLMVAGSTASLARDSGATNSDYPHDIGSVGVITGGILTSSSSASYYYFYNWTVSTGTITCESPRKEVVATVNDAADEDVVSIPYSHSGNTEDYYNNYTGIPGVDCGSVDNYLDGYDVVYKYTADDDYVLTVSLDSISEQYSAVFVYESCADIGVSCAEEGSVAEDSIASHGFDMLVEEGESYYFVVSSAGPTESFDYILNINGYGCNDIPAPTTADASPYFMTGDNLSSLENYVDALRLSQGIKWYSDSSLTTEITDPDNEILVDGVSYYVTQEVIGCEGDALEFTPIEFDCSVLSPDIINEVVELCVPGGYARLKAELSPAGNELFWYEKETDTVAIQKGSILDLGYIEESTSYWVTEARLGGEGYEDEYGKVAPTTTSSYGSTLNYGLQFDVDQDFTLHSVDVYPDASGDLEISLFDSTGQLLDSHTETVSSSMSDPVTIVLDFEVPEGTGLRLLQTSSPSIALIRDSSGNAFPYELGDNGDYGSITNGTYGTSSTNSSSYYYFYNWEVGVEEVLCESDRFEVQVIVSDEIPDAPEVERNYTFCGIDTYTLADIEVEGDQLVWYDRVGNELEEDTEVEDGKTYYVVDKSGGCVSEIAEVSISVREYSDIPEGEEEQNFVEGETLADLDVNGVQLKWYADIDKEEPLDIDTKLEDKATYYVSQTKSGHCESEALGVTVTLVLGVDSFNFESFEYFPNPVENQMTLQNEKEIQSVEVYDMQGRAVIMQNNIHKNIVNIDFENISTGNYLMKVFVKDSMRTVHVIKK